MFIKKFLNIKIPLIVFLALAVFLLSAFFILLFFFEGKVNQFSAAIKEFFPYKTEFQSNRESIFGNFNFIEETKNNFLKERVSFIKVNLENMIIRVYIDGEKQYEAPILAKGREGSWWETPSGIYRAELKVERVFSSIGRVYTPWNVVFHGNFIIHGWPYYPDGRPVSADFSGGCVRLSDKSAKTIYNYARVGMPIIVFEGDFAADDFVYRSDPPTLSADSYIVADIKNHYVFFKKNSDKIFPTNSIAKLITSLVAIGHSNIENIITVPKNAIVPTDVPRLKSGQRVSIYNLLFPLLLESSNEAAETLTLIRRLGRERFVYLMNAKAESIGMENSIFIDPSGASEENKSTANDLFNLARYLYNNRGFILRISSGDITRSVVYGRPIFADLKNLNILNKEDSFFGGKSGRLPHLPKEAFLGVFEFEIHGEKRPVAIIILNSEDIKSDERKILDWIKFNYL